mgnify:CR=1 FL=1
MDLSVPQERLIHAEGLVVADGRGGRGGPWSFALRAGETAWLRLPEEGAGRLLFAPGGLVFGFALLLLDRPIYMLLEGRRFWPEKLQDWGVAQQAARLTQLQSASGSASGARSAGPAGD